MPAAPIETKTPIVPDVQLLGLRYSACGKFLAAPACDASVRRWDISGSAPVELAKITGFNGWVSSIAFHPDKSRMFASDSWGRVSCWNHNDKEAKLLWDIPNAHEGWARKIAIHPDGSRLATVGRDGFARIWATKDGAKLAEIATKDDLLAVAWHPDGKLLVTGNLHGGITAWDISTKLSAKSFDAKEMFLYDRIQDVGGVRCLAFLDDGKTLIAGGAKPVGGGFVQAFPLLFAFEWATGKRTATWQGEADTLGYVLDCKPHTAGQIIAVTSGQPGSGKLLFWKLGEAKPIFEVTKPNCHGVDIHPDGKRLAIVTTLGSNMNGKLKGKEYTGSHSPIVFWTITS